MKAAPAIEMEHTVQEIDTEARVHHILLNRPDVLNAMTPGMYRELRSGFLHAYGDDRIDVVVLEAAGKAFAAGGDLNSFLDIADSDASDAYLRFDEEYQVPFPAQLRSPKPVVAVVDGPCMAGGLVLALCSDVVIATQRATFCAPEARVGIFEPCTEKVLPMVVGLSRARYLTLTGATIDAVTAERWGIVSRLASDAGEAAAILAEVVAAIQAGSPDAIAMYRRGMTAMIPDRDLLEVPRFALGANGRNALKAFAAKPRQQPVWAPLSGFYRS